MKKNKYCKTKFLDKENRFPVLAVCCVFLFILNGFFGRYFMPSDPLTGSLSIKNVPPFFFSGGNTANLLGTDYLGRDVLSRLMFGGRAALIVAAVTIIIGSSFGILLGLFSGYYGGIIDSLVMRICDANMAFPSLIVALLLTTVMGQGFTSVVIAIAFSIWAKYTKVVRGVLLSLKEKTFIVQAKVIGARGPWIIFRHIFPNIFGMILVLLIQDVGFVILTESSLSFLGLSIQPPNPSWGSMVAEGRNTLVTTWWVSVFPAVAIMFIVISINLFGEWLKKWVDPTRRETRI
jgi:peptide/nickel transport system permease protein